MFNQLAQRKEIPADHASLRIRPARLDDAAAVLRLAALDSSPVPSGDLLLAEVGEEVWAAFSLEDGHAIADPMRPSADAVLILGERARQLHKAQRRADHGRSRVRFAI